MTDSLSDKLFLAIVILISNMSSRDMFEKARKKCDKYCEKYEDIVKYALIYSIFFSYTREHSTSIIGTALFGILDSY